MNIIVMTSEDFDARIEAVLRRVLGDRKEAAPVATAPLVDKQTLGRLLTCSTAKIDKLVRAEKIPYLFVGEVRRFDVASVRAALSAPATPARATEPPRDATPGLVPGVRMLRRNNGR